MKYQEFAPVEALKPYVKCFYVIEYDAAVVQDKAFAMGCLELMFNVGSSSFETGRGSGFSKTPKVELWGQIIEPLTFRSLGKGKMLGARFFPHTAALFISDPINLFNDVVSDFNYIAGKDAEELHEKLCETNTLSDQIQLFEDYLISKFHQFQKKHQKFKLVNSAMTDLKREDFFDRMEDVASRYGISARYLQKLFVEFTGVSPKLYQKIHRFQKSLLLTGKQHESLTDIAYECGYFDQSHFVRDFKFFTGMAPSAFDPTNSSAILMSPIK
jgi:AraC-like DNA-binding protein